MSLEKGFMGIKIMYNGRQKWKESSTCAVNLKPTELNQKLSTQCRIFFMTSFWTMKSPHLDGRQFLCTHPFFLVSITIFVNCTTLNKSDNQSALLVCRLDVITFLLVATSSKRFNPSCKHKSSIHLFAARRRHVLMSWSYTRRLWYMNSFWNEKVA